MAAAAARTKNRDKASAGIAKDQNDSNPPMGIAAIAAAAARERKTKDDKGAGAHPPGGIAAMAAAAARSKIRDKPSSDIANDQNVKSPPMGIAAIAAAAARERKTNINNEAKVHPPGGIAAMAAAAASKKNLNIGVNDTTNNNEGGGGIAAMAAAAALKRRTKGRDTNSESSSAPVGIAAMAAAAARTKNKVETTIDGKNSSPPMGIAAIAAAAARERTTKVDNDAGAHTSGGIAAMAAAAARKKNVNKNGFDGANNNGGGGGIAAMAAAAARTKNRDKTITDVAKDQNDKSPPMGIAAIAAAAARERKTTGDYDTGGHPAGGIAAMAAAAARKKNVNINGNEAANNNGGGGGGIAAMAAAAALKRRTKENDSNSDSNAAPVGIAAIAAAAAEKRSSYQSGVENASIVSHDSYGSTVRQNSFLSRSRSHLTESLKDEMIDISSSEEFHPSALFTRFVKSKWFQMVSKWKHGEMILALTSRPTSEHFEIDTNLDEDENNFFDKSRGSSSVTADQWSHPSDSNVEDHDPKVMKEETEKYNVFASRNRNLNGFSPADQMLHADLTFLSPYLTNFGRMPRCCCIAKKTENSVETGEFTHSFDSKYVHLWVGNSVTNPSSEHLAEKQVSPKIIRQKIRRRTLLMIKPEKKFSGNDEVINYLLHAARGSMKRFYAQLDEIVRFSSQNNPSPKSIRATSSFSFTKKSQCRANFSVDIKTKEAIIDKANRKYNNDVLQVKDILRGQITLPDEGALVCALVFLSRSCRNSLDSSGRDGKWKGVKIVRIKNLFKMSMLGTIVPSDLPTGYRHLLMNIRLPNGLLAGTS